MLFLSSFFHFQVFFVRFCPFLIVPSSLFVLVHSEYLSYSFLLVSLTLHLFLILASFLLLISHFSLLYFLSASLGLLSFFTPVYTSVSLCCLSFSISALLSVCLCVFSTFSFSTHLWVFQPLHESVLPSLWLHVILSWIFLSVYGLCASVCVLAMCGKGAS